MKKPVEEPLIKGSFEAERAIEILSTLFTSKIQLHNVKTFNSFIRTGTESIEDNSRKVELKNSLARLQSEIASINEDEFLIHLDCQVKLTAIKKTTQGESIQRTETVHRDHA
jgi:dihydroorotase